MNYSSINKSVKGATEPQHANNGLTSKTERGHIHSAVQSRCRTESRATAEATKCKRCIYCMSQRACDAQSRKTFGHLIIMDPQFLSTDHFKRVICESLLVH